MTSKNSITDLNEIFGDEGVGVDTSIIGSQNQQKDITDLGEIFTVCLW